MLAAAQTTLCKSGVEGFPSVTPYIISVIHVLLKSFAMSNNILNYIHSRNLSSWMNYTVPMICPSPFEWKDGILSTILKQCSEDERPAEKWILFDDPIDAMQCKLCNAMVIMVCNNGNICLLYYGLSSIHHLPIDPNDIYPTWTSTLVVLRA